MRIFARDVAEAVAAECDLTFADLYSQRRTRAYARPRQVAMYAIRKLCPHMSHPAIGRLLGGRDHTTILYGVRLIEAMRHTDDEVAGLLDAVLVRFGVASISAAGFADMCAAYSANLESHRLAA